MATEETTQPNIAEKSKTIVAPKPVTTRRAAVKKPATAKTVSETAKPAPAPRRRTPARKPAIIKPEISNEIIEVAPLPAIEVFAINEIFEQETFGIKKKNLKKLKKMSDKVKEKEQKAKDKAKKAAK
ncbi:MAG: hypothetical protein H7174_10460, partial [Flavobacterium sp.]|nr:hypothetical protein [Flavobacterium sp.]